jgi:hypothetical protein
LALTKTGGWFHTDHFVSLVDGIFTDAVNATGNAGQVAILNEIYENSVPVLIELAELGRKPNKTILRSLFVVSSSPEKYNAVSDTLLEVIEKMGKAWDDAYAGDSQGQKLYLEYSAGEFINTPPSANALMYGFRASFYGRI